jgi:hypothetical protein
MAPQRDNDRTILIFRMNRLFLRGNVLTIVVLVAFNATMMGLWVTAGPSRDALVVACWIAGDGLLCLISLWATDR